MKQTHTVHKIISTILALFLVCTTFISEASAAKLSMCSSPQVGDLFSYSNDDGQLNIQPANKYSFDTDGYVSGKSAYIPSHAYMYPFMDFSNPKYMPIYAMYEVVDSASSVNDGRYFLDDVILALSPDVKNSTITSANIISNSPYVSTSLQSNFKVGKNQVSASTTLTTDENYAGSWDTIIKFNSKGTITSIQTQGLTYKFNYKNGKLSSIKQDGKDFMEYTMNKQGQITKITAYGGLPVITCNFTYNANGILAKTKYENKYNDSAIHDNRTVTLAYNTVNGTINSVSYQGKETDEELKDDVYGEAAFDQKNWDKRNHTIEMTIQYQ